MFEIFNADIFSSRLKTLRIAHNLTIKELSRYCNCIGRISLTSTTLSYWENNKRTPVIDSLFFLSSIYAISIDWLIGRTDIPYAENVILNLEPKTFPVTINVHDVEVKLPIEFPEEYIDYNLRKLNYDLPTRANIVFITYVISYEWERFVKDRIYEFADKNKSAIELHALKLWDYFMTNSAQKDILEKYHNNLQHIIKNKKPIFDITKDVRIKAIRKSRKV